MPVFLQHLLVLLLVAGCLGVVGVQFVRTFAGKRSKLGSCCSAGCPPVAKPNPGERIVFIPSDSLSVRRRG